MTRTGTVNTDKKFTGQRLDGTGLYYYNARYYDPTIERFISPDSTGQNLNNPQTLNRYSYYVNNPLKYTDPTGQDYISDHGGGTIKPPDPEPPVVYDPFWDYSNRFLDGFSGSFVNTFNTIKKFQNDPLGFWSDIGYSATHFSDTANALIDFYDVSTPEGVGHVLGDVTQAIIIKKGIDTLKAPPIPAEGVPKLLGLWSETASAQGIANKLNHVFGNATHSFDPLLEQYAGNQLKAFKALEVATQQSINASGATGTFINRVVKVAGYDAEVSGTVQDNIRKIGSARILK